MGAASFLEDIQKARDDAIHFRRLLTNNAFLDGPIQQLAEQARKAIPGYLHVLNEAIAHFDRILEIATNPSMDLAEEILRLHAEIEVIQEKSSAKVEALASQIAMLKRAAASSKQSIRDELKRREGEKKEVIAKITKDHVRELERLKTTHQIEKNGLQKELEGYKASAVSKLKVAPEKTCIDASDLDFKSALSSFEPKDEDVR